MSVRKLAASLLAALAMFGSAVGVNAQQPFQNAPPADPFAFDPDFNWFEPVSSLDLADLKPNKRAPTGWFATYDRLVLYGSRPETTDPQRSETQLDTGYGHRYELGYINRENKGWTFNWTQNEVAQAFFIRREASNRTNGPELSGGAGGNADVDPFFGFVTPPEEGNNPGSDFRFFDVEQTENVFKYDSYELNKTWQLEPYHYGGILEPLIGIRWQRIRDTNRQQQLSLANNNINTSPFIIAGQNPLGDQLFTQQAFTDNELLGGQFGFRYFKYRDRFTYSTDFRVFLGGNFQSSRSNTEELLVVLPGAPGAVADGAVATAIERGATAPINSRNEEFFIGFDIRGEIGYQLTKLINVRAGFQIIDIGTGVWRGGAGFNGLAAGDQDQDLVLVGGTFGLTLNH